MTNPNPQDLTPAAILAGFDPSTPARAPRLDYPPTPPSLVALLIAARAADVVDKLQHEALRRLGIPYPADRQTFAAWRSHFRAVNETPDPDDEALKAAIEAAGPLANAFAVLIMLDAEAMRRDRDSN